MRTERGRQRFLAAGWIISAGVMGVAAYIWQLHLREVEERAEEAERTRDEVARRRAVEERLRIARELHDSLTHSISVIQVQAGVAVHLARKRGEEVPPALLAIEEAGADAVRELRATLGALRSEEDNDGSGLGQLDSLVTRARAGGIPVELTVTGRERPLPPDVDQAAYRIVQEALTNVSRHADHAGASVHVHYGPETISIQVDNESIGTVPDINTVASSNAGSVTNNGSDTGSGEVTSAAASTGAAANTSARPPGRGLGLVGMRERVSALGGKLQVGPQDDGGFQVLAELPARTPS